MQGVSRWFLSASVIFALVGMALGLRMGISQSHDQIPTHAHIMLVGWVNSALMGFFYHLFPAAAGSRLAYGHFLIQTVGAVIMSLSLWMIYSGHPAFGPGAGIGASAVLIGMAIFAWVVLRQAWRR